MINPCSLETQALGSEAYGNASAWQKALLLWALQFWGELIPGQTEHPGIWVQDLINLSDSKMCVAFCRFFPLLWVGFVGL